MSRLRRRSCCAGLSAFSGRFDWLQSGETLLGLSEYVAEALEAEAVGFVVGQARRDLVAERGDDRFFEGICSLGVVLVQVVVILCCGAVVGGHALGHCCNVLGTAAFHLSIGEDVGGVAVPDICGDKGVCDVGSCDGETLGDVVVVDLCHEFGYELLPVFVGGGLRIRA